MRIIFIAILFFCTGCSSMSSKMFDAEKKQRENSAIYVTGVVDALDVVTNRTPEIIVAEDLARSAQAIEGIPDMDKQLDVGGLIRGEKKAEKDLAKLQSEDSKNAKVVKKAREKLVDLGIEKEAENRKSIFKRILFWTLSSFGIGGTIALCVFVPAAFPIILKILGWMINGMIKLVPSLFSFIGVVGKSTLDNVVEGVGKVREELKNSPKTTYSASEVQELLDNQLKSSLDKHDKDLIEKIRNEKNI